MQRPANPWNPTGGTENCAACVARYLFHQLTGSPLPDHIAVRLEAEAAPRDRDQPFNHDAQVRLALVAAEALIEGAGLTAGNRVAAGFGARLDAGHYAVFSINRRGHVVYGHIAERGGSMRLFDPQINRPIDWGQLGPNPVARSYTIGTRSGAQ